MHLPGGQRDTISGRLKTNSDNGQVIGFTLGSHTGTVTHPSTVDTRVVSPTLGEASIGHGKNSSHLIPEIIGEINDVKFTLKEVPFGSVVAFRRVLTIDVDGTGYRVVGVGRKGLPIIEDDGGRRLADTGRRGVHVHKLGNEEALFVVLLVASGLIDVVRNQEWLPRVKV